MMMRGPARSLALTAFAAGCALLLASAPVFAAQTANNLTSTTFAPDLPPDDPARADPLPPPEIANLENLPKENLKLPMESGMPMDIRKEAVHEAAFSYGARGGLSWRTYAIRQELNARTPYLDKVFDFSTLLIPAPSGLLIEPPVISESINAMIINTGGQQAAVADRYYEIVNNAKIVSAPRSWRNYLERDWGEVKDPPDILRPENDEEREQWKAWVRKGWDDGVAQADEIFQDDLNQLIADYRGMVRYRMLLAQGMITPPYALQVDRGITGDGKVMRVGDRAVEITGAPQFMPGAEGWQPASR
jgi:defect-in-organelle-trafficking protein DotC